jgi:hypothetical protein
VNKPKASALASSMPNRAEERLIAVEEKRP